MTSLLMLIAYMAVMAVATFFVVDLATDVFEMFFYEEDESDGF